MHCWCPPATGPNQPHQSDCVQYKRPTIQATVGSYHDWDLTEAGSGLQYTKIDPEAWTFGKMAAKIIADAVAAAESASGQGELPATEIPPEISPEPPPELSVDFIEVGPIQPMQLTQQLTQKEKQALAYVQSHAMAAHAKYEAKLSAMQVQKTL
jgi:hypothetical protein